MLRKSVAKTALQNGYKLLVQDISTSATALQKDVPSHAHAMGSCGTTRWVGDQEKKVAEAKVSKIDLPAHLIRPPCIPGSQPGGFQTCVQGDAEGGMYCIPCKERYKYPSFSENIDFIPPQDQSCWWKGGNPCFNQVDEAPLGRMTQTCPTDIDL